MSSLWDVPQYLIMAFSLAFPTPAGKASRVSLSPSQETSPQRSSAASASASAFAHPGARIGDETWLRTMKAAGPASDVLSGYASRIFVTSSGKYYVPVAAERAEILKLKDNPEVAIRVTAAATANYAGVLARQTGRRVSQGALLVAHVAGLRAAAAYARALEHRPHAKVSVAVPALSPFIANTAVTLAALDRHLSAALGDTLMHVASDGASGRGTLKGSLTKGDPRRETPRTLASVD